MINKFDSVNDNLETNVKYNFFYRNFNLEFKYI